MLLYHGFALLIINLKNKNEGDINSIHKKIKSVIIKTLQFVSFYTIENEIRSALNDNESFPNFT